MGSKEDPLTFLIALNGELADRDAVGRPMIGPGLPPWVEDTQRLVTTDRIAYEGWQES
jgi:hypothetical protein